MLRSNMSRGNTIMNHDLQELELELQLLKRKREILQQQQQIIASPFSSQPSQHGFDFIPLRSYDQPQSSRQDYNKFDFSRYYDEDNSSVNYNRRGVKRPASGPKWDTGVAPKRFSGPTRTKPNKGPGAKFQGSGPSNERSMPRNSNEYTPNSKKPRPLMDVVSKNKPNSKPSTYPKNITKPKVNKPKPPNDLDTPQVTTEKAVDPVAQQSNFYNADSAPSPLVNGRLEFALGRVVKEMRQGLRHLEPYGTLFHSDRLLRPIKQVIRERLRKVMAGKHVGNLHEILAEYRKHYPKEGDKEAIDNAPTAPQEQVEKKLDTKVVGTGSSFPNPERYFRSKITKLLGHRLDEMIEAVQSVYEAETLPDIQTLINENIPDMMEIDNDSGKNKEEKDSKEDVNTNVSEDVKLEVVHEEGQQTNETPKGNDVQVKDDGKDPESTDYKIWKQYNEKFFNIEFYEKLASALIAKKLPILLAKQKGRIIHFLNVDGMYQDVKSEVIPNSDNEQVNDAVIDNQPTVNTHNRSDLFVKIMSRPMLPKRRVMKSFLDNYNPRMTKRHKTIRNLLYVGLRNKEDFERILKADGTYIGSAKLSILVSIRGNQKENSTTDGDDTDVQIIENIQENLTDKNAQTDDLVEVNPDNLVIDLEAPVENSEATLTSEPVQEDTTVLDKTDTNDDSEQVEDTVDQVNSGTTDDGNEKEGGDENITDLTCDDDEVMTDLTETVEDKQDERTDDGNKEETEITKAVNKQVAGLENKNDTSTPTRSSQRIAKTPATACRTRRASKLL